MLKDLRTNLVKLAIILESRKVAYCATLICTIISKSILVIIAIDYMIKIKQFAHPGNRTPVSTVGGYYDTTTLDALYDGETYFSL